MHSSVATWLYCPHLDSVTPKLPQRFQPYFAQQLRPSSTHYTLPTWAKSAIYNCRSCIYIRGSVALTRGRVSMGLLLSVLCVGKFTAANVRDSRAQQNM